MKRILERHDKGIFWPLNLRGGGDLVYLTESRRGGERGKERGVWGKKFTLISEMRLRRKTFRGHDSEGAIFLRGPCSFIASLSRMTIGHAFLSRQRSLMRSGDI